MLKIVPTLVFTFLFVTSAFAQDSTYVRRGAIGKENPVAANTAVNREPFSFLPASSWVGERFIFLPKPKTLQQFGYSDFFDLKLKTLGRPVGIDYEPHVGKIIKVISVTEASYRDWTVEFELEGSGQRLKARTSSDRIGGLGLVSDIDNARAKYLGKILWYGKTALGTYNEATDKHGKVALDKQWSPVKVVDIVAGWYEDSPVMFILQTPSGEEGITMVTMSGTNSSNPDGSVSYFKDRFFTEDPRKVFSWPANVWSAIEARKVFVGMTQEQVIMSWGKPRKVNTTITTSGKQEQWVCWNDAYLYFTNGILTSIQD